MRRVTQGLVVQCIPKLSWPDSGTVADIGGGLGMLLAAVLHVSPLLKGMMIEQAEVLERSCEFLSAEQVASRCEFRAASLFDPVPPADVSILSSVLHDWPDDAATRILAAAASDAKPSAVQRVFDRLIPDDASPHSSKAFDTGMLLLTSGRERSVSELGYLLKSTGWELEEILPGYGPVKMIQARRV
jgi:hypothetical protein